MSGVLERSVRRLLLRALGMRKRVARVGAYELLAAPRSILLVRPDRIGDVVISTPLIRLLRRRFPAVRMDIVLGAKNGSIASILPDLNSCYVLHPSAGRASSTLQHLRSARYDIAVNLVLKTSASSEFITRAVRSRLTIGFGLPDTAHCDIAIAPDIESTHVVSATSRILSLFGIRPIGPEPACDEEHLHLAIPPSDLERGSELVRGTRPLALLNVSASTPQRRLGTDWSADLCRQILERGIRPFVVGAPGDEVRIAAVARASGADMIAPTDSLAEFAGILHAADAVVTPDSSIVHIAGAMRRPTVTLFGSVETMQAWGPWGVPSASFVRRGAVDAVSTEQVADAVVHVTSVERDAGGPPSIA